MSESVKALLEAGLIASYEVKELLQVAEGLEDDKRAK